QGVYANVFKSNDRSSSMILHRLHSKLFFALFMIWQLFAATAIHAQGNKGTVTGRVTDSAGGVLQGARILLEPGGLSRVSDAQGEFTIPGGDAGTYVVTISFVGLQTYSGSLDVKNGTVVRADAELKIGTQSQEVIVTAERARGEAEAINRERTADNVLQV